MTVTQRSKEEVISLILQSAKIGATQTTLMYQTFLSHDALKGYLAVLFEKGHLEYLAGEMKFKTTAAGLERLLSISEEIENYCSHQCKKCGVLYRCGENPKCPDPFHHGICQVCLKVFSSESISNQVTKTVSSVPYA